MDTVQSRPIVMARSGMPRISQETLAIIGVTIALAGLILTNTAGLRGEIQAVRTEARADREAMRVEVRADRKIFQNHILRLTEQQGILRARLDGTSDPLVPSR